MKLTTQAPVAKTAAPIEKCGPRTLAHADGGGLTYIFCTSHAGHAGRHTV